MSRINDNNYVERVIRTGVDPHTTKGIKKIYRDWWLPQYISGRSTLSFYIGRIFIPKRLKGKRLRFKVEVLER